MLWSPERNKRVRCLLCARRCSIPEGQKGFCNVRINKDGKLYTLTFGKFVTVNVDPIEKKPFFHYYPGSKSLSIASPGCNMRCKFCCNWRISQIDKVKGRSYTPEEIVKLANKNKCKTIAYTYTEPTLMFEFIYRAGKLAHRYNIKNVIVTNGYMSVDAVKKISRVLDAAVVDVKASLDPEFYKNYMEVPRIEPIYDCIKQLHKQRIFLEITNLIVPEIGDSFELNDKLASWIAEISSEIPYHVLRFMPEYQLKDLPPTPIKTLERMIDDANRRGLRYVYIGNVFGHEAESTYCFNCRQLLVKRTGFYIEQDNLVDERCPYCGFRINIVTS